MTPHPSELTNSELLARIEAGMDHTLILMLQARIDLCLLRLYLRDLADAASHLAAVRRPLRPCPIPRARPIGGDGVDTGPEPRRREDPPLPGPNPEDQAA
jgi:hypothetical protein